MIFNLTCIGSGGIAFELKTAPSIDSLPADAEPGEVYLVTDKELTGVTYYQPTEPVGTFELGDVWVRTQEASKTTINLAEEGSIIVGLYETYVWDGAAWQKVDFRVRLESGWEEPGVLISAGLQKVEFVGQNLATTGGITQNDGYISTRAQSGASAYYRTKDLIDLTAYKTLHCKAKNAGTVECAAGLWAEGSTAVKPDPRVTIAKTLGEVTIDLSTVNGSYYVGVWGDNSSDGGTSSHFRIDLYDLWLE